MGGHAAGEVASEMAVRFVARELGSLKGLADDQVADRMRTAIRAANGAIFQRTLTEHDKRGMGTTVTALVLYGNRFLIGQVGDSRAYLYRDDKLVQLTKDHSYVQEQVDAGYLTPEQARSHPYSNVITRCVGANSEVMPDVYLGTVKPSDLFLLASDGLTGMLDDLKLAELLGGKRMPEEQVDELIGEANRHGGLDNITAIVVRVDAVETSGRGRGGGGRGGGEGEGERGGRWWAGDEPRGTIALGPSAAQQRTSLLESCRHLLPRRHHQLHDSLRRQRRRPDHEHAQPTRRAVQLGRDARQSQMRVRARVGPGQLGHGAVALHERQAERQHVQLGREIEEQLARREADLARQPILHPLQQVRIVGGPGGRDGREVRGREVEGALREAALAQRALD